MDAAKIDEALLPDVCALDTGVLLLALRQRSHRPDAPASIALWKALLGRERIARGAKVLVPAPALAELIRGSQTTEPPMVRGVAIAPFTRKTARILARTFPQSFIDVSKQAGNRDGDRSDHRVVLDVVLPPRVYARDTRCLLARPCRRTDPDPATVLVSQCTDRDATGLEEGWRALVNPAHALNLPTGPASSNPPPGLPM